MRYATMGLSDLADLLHRKRMYLAFLKSDGRRKYGSKHKRDWPADVRQDFDACKAECKQIEALMGIEKAA